MFESVYAFIDYGFPARTRSRSITGHEEMALQERQGQERQGREQPGQADDVDQAILNLLGHRYGDGLVYLRSESEQRLFDEAVQLGLVSSEGYVTPRGLSLLAHYGDD